MIRRSGYGVDRRVCHRTLRVEDPYAGMNIAGVTEVTETQKAALKVLGTVEDEPLMGISRQLS